MAALHTLAATVVCFMGTYLSMEAVNNCFNYTILVLIWYLITKMFQMGTTMVLDAAPKEAQYAVCS